MKLRSKQIERKPRIEIVPLIDIMFFLLATFVMVSASMIKNRGIPVNLPQAYSGATQERKDFVSLTVTEKGEFFLAKNQVTKEQLPLALQSLKQNSQDPKVFINGDEKASVKDFVAALDEVRKAGITKVAIETEAKNAG